MQSSNSHISSGHGLGQFMAQRERTHTEQPLGQISQSLKNLAQQCCNSECEQNVGSTERLFSTGFGGVLVASGLLRGRLRGLLLTVAGGALLYRGLSGHCSVYQQLGISTSEVEGERSIVKGLKIEETITINRSAHDLYQKWTRWESLPEILPHIDQVRDLGQGRTRWTARGPLATRLTWDAEVINQETDRLVAWQSLSGGDIDTAGSVHFDSLGANLTEMTVSMQYDPPGGKLTAMVSEFLGVGLDQRLRKDLQRFKATMEASHQSGTQLA